MYHLDETWEGVHRIPTHERKWILERFIEQKKKEEEERKHQESRMKARSPRVPSMRRR